MSHKFYKPAKSRLQRSELAVPGSSPKMFEKALNSKADYVFLDLEDAVSPNDKISARANVIKALNEINWRENGKTISVRINSLDTHYMYSDLIEIVEQAGENIDTILIPKAGTESDVYMVDCMLTQIETNKKIKKLTANPIAILPYVFNLASFFLRFITEDSTILLASFAVSIFGLLLFILFSIFFYYM